MKEVTARPPSLKQTPSAMANRWPSDLRNTGNEQNEKATRQLGGLFFKGE